MTESIDTKPEPAGESTCAGKGRAAFAEATGLVYQIVGLVFALGGCCFWSLSGLAQEEAADTARAGEWFLAGEGTQIVAALQTAVTFVGGLGMVAAGMGMSAAMKHSAVGGMIASGVLSLVWGAGAVVGLFHVVSAGSVLAVLISLVMTGTGVVLFLLAGVSRRDILEHPRDTEESAAGDIGTVSKQNRVTLDE